MTAPFLAAYEQYARTERDSRGALWTLCCETYSASHHTSCAKLADTIRENKSSVEDWAAIGWLVAYCSRCHVIATDGKFTLDSLWHDTDVLSYDHLLRVAKLTRRYEISPLDVLERLYNAMQGGQYAESLQRDIEEAHEPPAVLLRRDWKRDSKKHGLHLDTYIFRGVSETARELWKAYADFIEGELKRLESVE